ncbi:hypothetical protein [Streptomyces tricolor]
MTRPPGCHPQDCCGDPSAHQPAPLPPANQAAEHTCGNCEGIDPGSCLVNPDRQPADRAVVRAEALREGADAAERLMDERYGPDCSYAIGGMDVARELRRLAGEPPANSKAPTDRSAIERAFAERLAAELTGCCTECDACIEIAQHLAGKDEPAAEERKQPPMDPVYILGIAADAPAPVAEQPAAADAEETRGGCGHGPERHGPEFGCVECRCPSTTGHA